MSSLTGVPNKVSVGPFSATGTLMFQWHIVLLMHVYYFKGFVIE